MKLNRKGFMMAEVVVVSAIILGVLISIYTSYGKVFRRYSEVLNYYNVDCIYKLASVRDKLIADGSINNYFGSDYTKYNDNVYFFKKDYLTEDNIESIPDIKINFKDYLNYLRESTVYNTDGEYIMVIEWPKDEDNYYYNYLELEV